jgi:hypothetical protein
MVAMTYSADASHHMALFVGALFVAAPPSPVLAFAAIALGAVLAAR